MEKKKPGKKDLLICAAVLVGGYAISTFTKKDDLADRPRTERVASPTSCMYSSAKLVFQEVGTDKVINEGTINGCYTKKLVDQQLKMYEVANETGTFRLTYYEESTPNVLRFLDMHIAGRSTSWRANKGHDIFMIEENGKIGFVFGDRKKDMVKGTIQLQ